MTLSSRTHMRRLQGTEDILMNWSSHFNCFWIAQPTEKAMATHSSTLAWKIPWTEEPGRLQSMGSLRVGHDWATSLSLSCIGEGNGKPLQCSCLENPRDRGAWWAALYGVAKSQTRLKRLSSSSSTTNKIYQQEAAHGTAEYILIIRPKNQKIQWPLESGWTWFTSHCCCVRLEAESASAAAIRETSCKWNPEWTWRASRT